MSAQVSTADLVAMLGDARARTLELVSGLDQERLMGPQSEIVNPLLWEIGHLAWFHEQFILRGLDRAPPQLAAADGLYDSARVPHATRWSIPLPALPDTLAYMARVQDALVRRLDGREPTAQEAELYQLVTFHEDMHDEAFTYTRQTLGYPRPSFAASASARDTGTGPWPGDVAVGGGTWQLGAEPGGFVFDNEKWAHAVRLAPFAIDRRPVSNAEFLAFVEDGGYERLEWWSEQGRQWLADAGRRTPRTWRRGAQGWQRRAYDAWLPLAPNEPVLHVSAFEAEAWCRRAGRRLPTEAEWECAAKTFGEACSPWGHVWQWTASPFAPYAGFSPDAYEDYSRPWFHTHRAVRGGSFATPARLLDPVFRNFYEPQRDDIFVGFRSARDL